MYAATFGTPVPLLYALAAHLCLGLGDQGLFSDLCHRDSLSYAVIHVLKILGFQFLRIRSLFHMVFLASAACMLFHELLLIE